MLTFFFARLWRRAGVLTDAEVIELRYGRRSRADPARLLGRVPGAGEERGS